MADLIEPLCVAALNTPADQASAAVFLRVLNDALFTSAGSSDLLLPRTDLGLLLPEPACAWLVAQGAQLRWRTRVQQLAPHGHGWQVDGESFDQVLLATPPWEAAGLIEPLAPAWAALASALRFEPIVTVFTQGPPVQWAAPMLALRADARQPAQFVFDLGALRDAPGVLAFVISGAAPWVAEGMQATEQAVCAQARGQLGLEVQVVRSIAEKRATFVCAPAMQRPGFRVAPGLWAAGDYIAGPYPATLEGAVRSGCAAADAAVAAAGLSAAAGTAPPADRR